MATGPFTPRDAQHLGGSQLWPLSNERGLWSMIKLLHVVPLMWTDSQLILENALKSTTLMLGNGWEDHLIESVKSQLILMLETNSSSWLMCSHEFAVIVEMVTQQMRIWPFNCSHFRESWASLAILEKLPLPHRVSVLGQYGICQRIKNSFLVFFLETWYEKMLTLSIIIKACRFTLEQEVKMEQRRRQERGIPRSVVKCARPWEEENKKVSENTQFQYTLVLWWSMLFQKQKTWHQNTRSSHKASW